MIEIESRLLPASSMDPEDTRIPSLNLANNSIEYGWRWYSWRFFIRYVGSSRQAVEEGQLLGFKADGSVQPRITPVCHDGRFCPGKDCVA